MRSKQAWAIINQHRRAIADLLAGLDESEWDLPSDCAGWTVREVAAHLLRERPGVGQLTDRPRALLSRRIDHTDRALAAVRVAAARPTGAIVADLRSLATRRHRTESPFWAYVLIEVLVHGADIARPLHRSLPMPVEAAAVSATRVWNDRRWPASDRLADLRLTANDSDWAVGAGARVSGSTAQLLLLLTGRDVVDELDGPGRSDLVQRFQDSERRVDQ